MPTYKYKRADGSTFEIVQRITEEALTHCPYTGQPVKRLISAANVRFKGGGVGWASSGYSGAKVGDRKMTK